MYVLKGGALDYTMQDLHAGNPVQGLRCVGDEAKLSVEVIKWKTETLGKIFKSKLLLLGTRVLRDGHENK